MIVKESLRGGWEVVVDDDDDDEEEVEEEVVVEEEGEAVDGIVSEVFKQEEEITEARGREEGTEEGGIEEGGTEEGGTEAELNLILVCKPCL